MYRFFFGISHIPKFRKILCTAFFSGYPNYQNFRNSMYRFFRDISYTKFLQKIYVPFFRIYPNNFYCTYVFFFVGISFPGFFEKVIFRIFFSGISHTYQDFFEKRYIFLKSDMYLISGIINCHLSKGIFRY